MDFPGIPEDTDVPFEESDLHLFTSHHSSSSQSDDQPKLDSFTPNDFPRPLHTSHIPCQPLTLTHTSLDNLFKQLRTPLLSHDTLEQLLRQDQVAMSLALRKLRAELCSLNKLLEGQETAVEELVQLNRSLHVQATHLGRFVENGEGDSSSGIEQQHGNSQSWAARSFSSRKESVVMEQLKEQKDSVLSFKVLKLKRYHKNTYRVLQIDTSVCLLGVKRGFSSEEYDYKISVETLVSCKSCEDNRNAVQIVFFKTHEKRLRNQKHLRLEFSTHGERERFLRIMKMTFPPEHKSTCHDYVPSPLSLSDTLLRQKFKNAQLPLETISSTLHESWMLGKLDSGWSYGALHDEILKTHPDLVPFDKLPPEEQTRNSHMVKVMLETVFALGFEIRKFSSGRSSSSIDLNSFDNLPDQLLYLVEYLAENLHDVWAHQKMQEGWVFGEIRDYDAKTHPLLISYLDLTEYDREADKHAACAILSTLLHLGYECVNPKRSFDSGNSHQSTK